MAEIRFGNSLPVDVRLGSAEVELYLGATKVWPPPAGSPPEPDRTLPSFIAIGAKGTQTNTANPARFTYPASGVLSGDFILAVVVINDRGGGADVSNTAPGWTHIAKLQSSELCVSAFYRFADGSEAATTVDPFDWDATGDPNDLSLCCCWQFRDVDPADPIDGVGTPTTGNMTSLNMPSVTTEVDDSLAIAAMGFTDNCTVADSSGETGGTWVSRGGTGDAAADDARVEVFSAAMATVGTLSGGSVAITGTTPQTARSGALGFALRGAPT